MCGKERSLVGESGGVDGQRANAVLRAKRSEDGRWIQTEAGHAKGDWGLKGSTESRGQGPLDAIQATLWQPLEGRKRGAE